MRHLRSPLARYGFPTLTVLAVATDQLLPTIACTILTALAWKDRRAR